MKGIGAGGYEYRIDFGPGYQTIFGKDVDRLVILLADCTKKRQLSGDVYTGREVLRDYINTTIGFGGAVPGFRYF